MKRVGHYCSGSDINFPEVLSMYLIFIITAELPAMGPAQKRAAPPMNLMCSILGSITNMRGGWPCGVARFQPLMIGETLRVEVFLYTRGRPLIGVVSRVSGSQ